MPSFNALEYITRRRSQGDSARQISRGLTRRTGYEGSEVQTARGIIIDERLNYVIIKTAMTYHVIDSRTGRLISEDYIPRPSRRAIRRLPI